MGYYRFALTILAVTCINIIICTHLQGKQITVHVDSSRIISRVDPAVYSFGLGCSLKFHEKYNISSPVLRRLAKELSPAYLRLGGTKCDFLTFHGHGDEVETETEYRNKTLPGKLWDTLNDFAEDVGFRLIFDLNVFLRTSDNKWDPSNCQQLLDYNSKGGYKVNFQLGNEPNSFPHKFKKTITPKALADDFKTLQAILKQRKLYEDSLLIGPDTTSVIKASNNAAKKYLQRFLDNIGDAVDVISTHFYYHKFNDDEPMIDFLTDPSTLDQFSANTATFKALVDNRHLQNGSPFWYGESGLLPGGKYGAALMNISDRFISGMVWLDKLGICGLNGVKVIVREILIGGGPRRLITPEYVPNPDYWSAVLYKRLVGRESLEVKISADGDGIERVRLYAHCTQSHRSKYGYEAGAVTVFGVNFSQHKAVQLLFNATSVDQFLLTPGRTDNITSQYIALNGCELFADKGSLPAMLPQPVTSKLLTFPAGSMGFFVLKDADFGICKNTENDADR